MFNGHLIPEEELIRRFFDRKVRQSAFEFILFDLFNDWRYINKIHVAQSISRKEFGLEPDGRPGDLDLLIIPEYKNKLYFNKSAVLEVKVVRPSLRNPGRNPNSRGEHQINGLVRDGFPYIGLLYVTIPEPFPKDRWIKLPIYDNLNDLWDKPSGKYLDVDPHFFGAGDRQEGRLKSLSIPVVIQFNEDADFIQGQSALYARHAKKNPGFKRTIYNKIRRHFAAHRERYVALSWNCDDKDGIPDICSR